MLTLEVISETKPTIVTKNAKNFMAIGSPGGPTIITTVLQCIMNVVDHSMTVRQAVTTGHELFVCALIRSFRSAAAAPTGELFPPITVILSIVSVM